MSKVKPGDIAIEERTRILNAFFDVVVSLEKKKEVIDFFVGMMTPSEAIMFARRMQIAEMLLKEHTYDDIAGELHVGRSTIAQVEKWLFMRDGAYKSVLEKNLLKKTKGKNDNRKEWYEGLDKYPEHRLAKKILGLG